jgi:hypothetical protein
LLCESRRAISDASFSTVTWRYVLRACTRRATRMCNPGVKACIAKRTLAVCARLRRLCAVEGLRGERQARFDNSNQSLARTGPLRRAGFLLPEWHTRCVSNRFARKLSQVRLSAGAVPQIMWQDSDLGRL